jgi:hypothetical protein
VSGSRVGFPRLNRRIASIGIVGLALIAVGRASGIEIRPASGAGAAPTRTIHVDPDTLNPWRFPVGERMEYSVTWEGIRLGAGSLSVEAIDTVQDRSVYRVALEMAGGPPFYRVEDRIVSWIQPVPFASLQFAQNQKEGNYRRNRKIVLDVESLTYTRYDLKDGEYVPHRKEADVPIPSGALDEISYLYMVRLLPLEVGQRYEFDRYFKKDGNPATVEVLRREEIRVPAGRFKTIVLRPEIATDGMFGEGGEAEVYLTDDEQRIPVRLKTSLLVGSGNLYLTGYDPGKGGALIEAGGPDAAGAGDR